MDRLRAVSAATLRLLALPTLALLGLALLGGCPEGERPVAPPASRVDAVAATPITRRDLEGFCDTLNDGPQAPKVTWPQMDQPAPAPGTPLWISLWATWCGPCIEEMPRQVTWTSEFKQAGLSMALHYVSVDDTPDIVAKFARENPQFPVGARMTDPKEVERLGTFFGAGPAVAIPIHVFTDGEQRIRCVRAGGVGDGHRGIVRQLLSGPSQ
jgi:thiol-disulfide isomerase/thioredoxin